MDFQPIIEFATQSGIWCLLFVWLFYTSRKESIDRETKLITIIEEQSNKLTQIANTLDNISNRLDAVEEKLEKAE